MDGRNKVEFLRDSEKFDINFNKICRFCLCETESGISINDKCLVEESKSLEEDSIYSFVTRLRFIKINNSLKFPTQVCQNCYNLIKLCYLFSQVCQKSDTLLKECCKNNLKDMQGIESEVFVENPHQLECNTDNDQKLTKIEELHQLNSTNIFRKYKQKLNQLFEKLKKLQLEISKPISEDWQHGCSQCPQKFKDPSALTSPIMAKHYQKKFKFQCLNCTKLFSNERKFERHIKIFHKLNEHKSANDSVNAQNEKNDFFCLYCTPCKGFDCQGQLVEHLKMSHNLQCDFPNQHSQLVHNENKHFVRAKPATLPSADKQKNSFGHGKPFVLPGNDYNPSKTSADDLVKVSGNRPGKSKTKDRPWVCSKCQASYSRKESLCHHMKEKHNQTTLGKVKCPEPNCLEYFPTNRQLLQHGIKIHQKYFADFHKVFRKVLQPSSEEVSKDKNFECDTCQKKYIYKSSLRKHILAAHLGMSDKDTVVCSYCKKTISSKLNLKSHIELVHEALFVYCPICKKKINFRTIGKHYATHKTTTDMIYSGKIFLCSFCGRILKSKRNFEDHQTLHKNVRNEVCNICGSGFTTKTFLRLHKRIHEGPWRKVFKCDQCDKVFNGKHSFNRHLLTHSGKKNFICEICSKCFYTIQELKRHVRYHKKEYRFDCQLCDKRFFDKSSFRLHMMNHKNVRPHKCQFCGKMFIVRGRMNSHMAKKHNVNTTNAKKVWKDPDTYVPLDDLL